MVLPIKVACIKILCAEEIPIANGKYSFNRIRCRQVKHFRIITTKQLHYLFSLSAQETEKSTAWTYYHEVIGEHAL